MSCTLLQLLFSAAEGTQVRAWINDHTCLQDLQPPSPNEQPAPPAFELTAAELRVFALGCLGGCLEASALSVDAKGVRVVGGPQRACLLTSPDNMDVLSVLHVQR